MLRTYIQLFELYKTPMKNQPQYYCGYPAKSSLMFSRKMVIGFNRSGTSTITNVFTSKSCPHISDSGIACGSGHPYVTLSRDESILLPIKHTLHYFILLFSENFPHLLKSASSARESFYLFQLRFGKRATFIFKYYYKK